MTALIPAALGVLILITAFISHAPNTRQHAIHAEMEGVVSVTAD